MFQLGDKVAIKNKYGFSGPFEIIEQNGDILTTNNGFYPKMFYTSGIGIGNGNWGYDSTDSKLISWNDECCQRIEKENILTELHRTLGIIGPNFYKLSKKSLQRLLKVAEELEEELEGVKC